MFKLYHIFTMCVCESIFLAFFFKKKGRIFQRKRSYMGRLENVSYDTWWEYWNGMENMNHVMGTCSVEPISSIHRLLHPRVLHRLHSVRASVCLYIYFCAPARWFHFRFIFVALFIFLQPYLRAVAITNCDDFSSHNISLQFTLWFRHVLCGDSALFSHFAPQWSLLHTLFYFPNTNLKLPFER